jgi:tryptophan synthase beta chain
MGSEDVKRQSPNVYRMKLLGATVVPVESGSKTLKDALNEAMRDWVANVDNTFYIIGTVAGPHPYPMMVRDFQSVIGKNAWCRCPRCSKPQVAHQSSPMRSSPAWAAAAMPWASSTLHPPRSNPPDWCGGRWRRQDSGKHSMSSNVAALGVLHGNRTYVLQDDNGQVTETHSISAGLDYPGVGPEHAFLKRHRPR